MKIKSKIIATGKTSAGMIIPEEFVKKLNGGRKPKVKVMFNDYQYRGSIAFMRDKFWLSVTNEVREKSGVQTGETVEVDIELDTEPRVVEIPQDFQKALNENPKAKEFFENLSYSHKRRHTLVIEDAKTPETRDRRIKKSIEMLLDGKK